MQEKERTSWLSAEHVMIILHVHKSGMLKNMADATDKLMDLQKKKRDLSDEPKKEQPNGITQNNVFVGSTTDLQRMILNQKSEIIDVDSTDK